MSRLRVGVIMGGKSIEREVSFNSGRTVCDHLDATRYQTIPLFQTAEGTLYLLPQRFLHRGKISDFMHRLAQEATIITWDELSQHIDFMFIAMHGQFAEDGTLQGMLELFGIPYLGSKVLASALSMDKIIQKRMMRHAGIDVPNGIHLMPHEITICNDEALDTLMRQLEHAQLSFPLIIKPAYEGSSLGVSIAHCKETLRASIEHACAIGTKPQPVIIEEKIEGMEFSCVSLFDYASGIIMPLPPTEIIPEQKGHIFDYEQKYMPGRATKHTPARCTDEQIALIQATCSKVTHTLGITTLSRIDGFLTSDGRVVIVDPNTLSGMGPASFLFREAAELNMSHAMVINHLIATELQHYGMLAAIEQQEQKEQLMQQPKLRVAVLLGGASNEREISLESGRNVSYKLSPQRYDVTSLYVSQAHKLYRIGPKTLIKNSTKEIEEILDPKSEITWAALPELFDFVFNALHGGKGENGSVQGTLQMLGIPYNGSGVLTSALCMDKHRTTTYLANEGFDVPTSMLVARSIFFNDPHATIERIVAEIGLPLIAKPNNDGCSVGVEKITSQEQLQSTLEALFAQEKKEVLIESYISGMELTVGCFGNDTITVLPPSQAVCHADVLSMQEKFLPGAGENQTPAPLPTQALIFVQQHIKAIYQTLQCRGYARIDCFYQNAQESPTGKERVIFLEANTLPALTPATALFHQAAEINMTPQDVIDEIVTLGLQEHHQAPMPKTEEHPSSSL